MEEKELWLALMDFIHDEELHCNNFNQLLELTEIVEDNIPMMEMANAYLTARCNLGRTIKELLDEFILHGERNPK